MKNPTEELTGIYFFTLVVGYFAYAQYDEQKPLSLALNMTYLIWGIAAVVFTLFNDKG